MSMLKINGAAWRSMRFSVFPQRFYSVAGICTARTSAICIFNRCGNAVRAPLWCDRDLVDLFFFHHNVIKDTGKHF